MGDEYINVKDSLRRMDGDEELFHDVLEAYVEDMPLRLAELDEAVAGGEMEAAARLAHTVKGASDNVGAEPMRDTAAGLMRRLRSDTPDGAEELVRDLNEIWTGTSARIASILGR